MSRLKQNQSIDSFMQSINAITESQCSLSEQDLIDLDEALKSLQFLKQKKGKTNEQILDEIAKIIGIINRIFFEKPL